MSIPTDTDGITSCELAESWLLKHKGFGWSQPLTIDELRVIAAWSHVLPIYLAARDAHVEAHAVTRAKSRTFWARSALADLFILVRADHRHLLRDLIPLFGEWSDVGELWLQLDQGGRVLDDKSPIAHREHLGTPKGGA